MMDYKLLVHQMSFYVVYFAPGRMLSIEIFVSLYSYVYFLFVCLSARISQNHMSVLHEIFCTCYLWTWLTGSVLL